MFLVGIGLHLQLLILDKISLLANMETYLALMFQFLFLFSRFAVLKVKRIYESSTFHTIMETTTTVLEELAIVLRVLLASS